MIRLYSTFETREAAEQYRDDMYRAYHPLGYGTRIEIEAKYKPDHTVVWVAFGSRAESCD